MLDTTHKFATEIEADLDLALSNLPIIKEAVKAAIKEVTGDLEKEGVTTVKAVVDKDGVHGVKRKRNAQRGYYEGKRCRDCSVRK